MPAIHLTTIIYAPARRVFDLSRSIDSHTALMSYSGEKAIAGTTTGLVEKGDCITWQARHLFKTRRLTTCITKMSVYTSFTDEMVEGDFYNMKHQHIFTDSGTSTKMEDIFEYTSPYGFLGTIADKLFLEEYMRSLLEKRNLIIKDYAETDKWKEILRLA